jgi:hypothetical protein
LARILTTSNGSTLQGAQTQVGPPEKRGDAKETANQDADKSGSKTDDVKTGLVGVVEVAKRVGAASRTVMGKLLGPVLSLLLIPNDHGPIRQSADNNQGRPVIGIPVPENVTHGVPDESPGPTPEPGGAGAISRGGSSPLRATEEGAGVLGTGGADLFEILDGVRRAKAAELAGMTTIKAEVLGMSGQTIDVPIEALLSPKAAIDATGAGLGRWLTTLQQTSAGSVPPPILVQPGARGTPIPDVRIDY